MARGRPAWPGCWDVAVVESAIRHRAAVVTSKKDRIRLIAGAARARLRIEAI